MGKVGTVGRGIAPKKELPDELAEDERAVERAFDNTLESASLYYRSEVDTEFYLVLVFPTREQKAELLDGLLTKDEAELMTVGPRTLNDMPVFIDGMRLAEKLGVKVSPPPEWKKAAPKPKWAAFSLPTK